jgi:hypothetical protein
MNRTLTAVALATSACAAVFAPSVAADDGWPLGLLDAPPIAEQPGPEEHRTLMDLEACGLGVGAKADRAARCVRVLTLVAPHRVLLHRSLRRILREGLDEEAVQEAAAALAELPDRDSADLLLWAGLTGRGGDAAASDLLDGYLGSSPPWPLHYLRFVAEAGPTPHVRALAAEAAFGFGGLRDAWLAPLMSHLDEAIDAGDAHAARFEALRAEVATRCDVAALPVTGKSRRCRLPKLPGRTPTPIIRLEPRIRTVLPTEVRRVGKEWLGAGAPRDFYRATGLGRRFRPMRVATTPHAVHTGNAVGRPPARRTPLPPGETPPVHAAALPGEGLPPDFWGFDPVLVQPAWYPAHVHLTIDDGPRPNTVLPALDVLDRHQVKVTFFLVGAALVRRWLDDRAGLDVVMARMLEAGHRVGYHSMNHDTLPPLHESEREPDQFSDSVALFRWILNRVAGRSVPVIHGRFPGGRGAFHAEMPELYAAAGLVQHVFWNFGPGFWVQDTPTHVVKGMACDLVKAPGPVTVLLHEYPMMAAQFEGFFATIREHCPADRVARTTDTRTIWRKDEVFRTALCGGAHPDARRLCEREPEPERPRLRTARRPRGELPGGAVGDGGEGGAGVPLAPER